MNIRTRFAPSPTGYLHIGSLRTALYAYLFAKNQGGELILRVEDTDRSRYVEGAVESLIDVLTRMSIDYDEGPVIKNGKLEEKGSYGPYTQSERTEMYKKYADELIEKGHAYRCFCSADRLESMRKEQQLAKMPTKYDRHCCSLTDEEVQKKLDMKEPYVVRMKVPAGETVVDDLIRGKVKFNNEEVDDQVLMKSDGFPTYHLAVVVDATAMEISHVIRAEEWLTSTPKHIMLYNMLGFKAPTYAHLPMVLNPDKSKLSKRQGDVAVEDYLAKGYLPEALNNFVALLGYNPKGDQEIYTMDELIKLFDLSKVNSSGAVFNTEKLDWMNSQYIKAKDIDELVDLAQVFLARAEKTVDEKRLEKIVTVERERMNRLDEIVEMVDMYQTEPEFADPAILIWKKSDAADAKTMLGGLIEQIENMKDDDFAELGLVETVIKGYI
ncbi:MAG: glutamate--tRNA ligase, partial [Candidatus Uhrbacteria bacterium]